ncbi:MAG: hypothetical protein Q7R64_02885, partial [bacterium]|nr:hypothetical protein [bacterium]
KDIDNTNRTDVTEYETGPLGRVQEYAITSKNPFVFDYGGKTWGTEFPDPDDPEGAWLFPIRSATRRPTTTDIRVYWDKWLSGLFAKGHDAVIIRNIRDVGSNHDGVMPLHTTIAVDQKAQVEMNARGQLDTLGKAGSHADENQILNDD